MSHGIEIHFDEKRGCLELACEKEAISQFRDLISHQLTDFPEIDVDKVVEVHITDTDAHVKRRNESSRLPVVALGAAIAGIIAFALIGIFSVATWLLA